MTILRANRYTNEPSVILFSFPRHQVESIKPYTSATVNCTTVNVRRIKNRKRIRLCSSVIYLHILILRPDGIEPSLDLLLPVRTPVNLCHSWIKVQSGSRTHIPDIPGHFTLKLSELCDVSVPVGLSHVWQFIRLLLKPSRTEPLKWHSFTASGFDNHKKNCH